jgi:hypothetical protein
MTTRRELTPDERHRIGEVLARLEYDATMSESLESLAMYVEGDASLCVPLVKQTAIVAQLVNVIDRSTVDSNIANALHILDVLITESQSQRACQPLIRQDKMRIFAHLLRNPALQVPLCGLLVQLFLGVDGDSARSSGALVGLQNAVLEQLVNFPPGTDDAIIVSLCSVVSTMQNWSQRKKQDELVPSVPSVWRALDRTLGTKQFPAAVALLNVLTLFACGHGPCAESIVMHREHSGLVGFLAAVAVDVNSEVYPDDLRGAAFTFLARTPADSKCTC